MTETVFTPLMITGLALCGIGFSVGIYDLMRDKMWAFTSTFLWTFAGVGLCLIFISAVQGSIESGNYEKANQERIENMTCSELHQGLLHNTINGTYADVQRATERYVAGCETK